MWYFYFSIKSSISRDKAVYNLTVEADHPVITKLCSHIGNWARISWFEGLKVSRFEKYINLLQSLSNQDFFAQFVKKLCVFELAFTIRLSIIQKRKFILLEILCFVPQHFLEEIKYQKVNDRWKDFWICSKTWVMTTF